jgi:hypothetical protein
MAFGKKTPAASGNKAAGKAAATKRKEQDRQPMQICTSWLLWCFEQAETKGGFLRMTCKMSSRSADGDGYGKGVYIDVMARIQPDENGDMTDIPEDDYSGGWIVVDGSIRAADWESDGKHGTDLTIWATSVRHGGDRR